MEEENDEDTPDLVVDKLPLDFNASAASPLIPHNPSSAAGLSLMPPTFCADGEGASLGTWGFGVHHYSQPPPSGALTMGCSTFTSATIESHVSTMESL
eukprot:9845198-Ditylum_brightwellii.AAC.1